MPAGADATERFGRRASAYARARPGYPDAAVAALSQALGLRAGATVVDLGCGTGLSCEPFLRAGFTVIGVEPNAPMRAFALERLGSIGGFRAVDGRAEATGLPAQCADLLIAAQAFHWFAVAATRAEALRVLRAPPQAALLWNDRLADGSAFARGYEALLRNFSDEYLEVRHRHERPERIDAFFGGSHWHSITVAHSDDLDLPRLADRVNSASYMPAPDHPRYAPMMAALRELFADTARDGVVTMQFETRILFGTIG